MGPTGPIVHVQPKCQKLCHASQVWLLAELACWHAQPMLQAGKLAPLAGPQPPFHHTSLDAKSELVCSKSYWRRKPDRVYEDSEDDDDDECLSRWAPGSWLGELSHPAQEHPVCHAALAAC